jgi:hypothetical protein
MPLPTVCINPEPYLSNFADIINTYATIFTDFSNNTSTTPATPNEQLNALYTDLQEQKKNLNQQIQSITSSTERHDRDFIDLQQIVVPNVSSVRVLDDYTLWTLMVSYILFACSIIFWYSHIHFYSLSSIAMSLGGMILVTFLLVALAIIVL